MELKFEIKDKSEKTCLGLIEPFWSKLKYFIFLLTFLNLKKTPLNFQTEHVKIETLKPYPDTVLKNFTEQNLSKWHICI